MCDRLMGPVEAYDHVGESCIRSNGDGRCIVGASSLMMMEAYQYGIAIPRLAGAQPCLSRDVDFGVYYNRRLALRIRTLNRY